MCRKRSHRSIKTLRLGKTPNKTVNITNITVQITVENKALESVGTASNKVLLFTIITQVIQTVAAMISILSIGSLPNGNSLSLIENMMKILCCIMVWILAYAMQQYISQ